MTSRPWTFRAAAVGVALAAATATSSTFAVAQADDAASAAASASANRHEPRPAGNEAGHDLDGPLSKTQEAQREEALNQVISGDAKVQDRNGSQVVKLKGKNKYVELGREKTDKIFTILVEFGDQVDSRYGGTVGPLHNQIAAPDRTKDNSTAWQADYNQAHFQDLYFGTGKNTESLKKYYEKQSSGRYSVDGEVTDWVKVPYNEARYGSNKASTGAWYAVQDGVTAWVADQKAAGRSDADIKADLAKYDQWDRYDYDGDGNFNEPDGYIDHFQIVHAGEDESAGGGAQGEDAIWAHRWYAFGTDAGATGPAGNKLGGAAIGDTGIWVGDYTIQPENGGLGVYAHEYGHDLGLPDEYDTTNSAENSTGFWTLMSSGSWLGTGRNAIGDLPGDMNAWDKLQLGWLNYDTAKAATKSKHKLGVAEYNTKNKQALVVSLPDKAVTTEIVAPAQGSTQWWSGSGNDLKNTLTRSVDLTGKSSAALTLDGWYDIEADYDYLYTEVSTDGGANWTAIDGTVDGQPIPRDGSGKPALTGTVDAYKKLSFPLGAYAGQKIDLRFRYQSDGGVALKGFAADEISVTADGSALFSDNAETADAAWTAAGFSRVGASFTDDYPQYYIAENRQYVSYDKTLKTGPYNFGFSTTRPSWVEHYPYQNGLLIWKWDTSQKDNNVSAHAGSGLILPIDSHSTALKWSDGTLMRSRIQSYDSPFSLYRTDGLTLHSADVATKIPSKPGVPVFNDHTSTYYDTTAPTAGVKITDTNTKIRIAKEARDGSTISLEVGPAVK
ncbi:MULTISPECIES: immune inhibitor A domain-containing protein [Streptomyces]|uniref:immune inhibitor A domain-containing protein n=1 Tax=Streptomyces TaxID=1883 RepID=UPI001162853F|nr:MULTISPECIES: immune inhibitor A domain-containing protein [unclassified Streptomyces]NMI58654.1 M6 family metalloprotease domain-containing protein [Streptomyces sp. RLA2-12]QDN57972.1 M6 family metalloprotease domain-containing protein [Streptomyces sp. S1D4-20]QDN68068.1 M6 family metalloprotease domain-containing protein [Streptomyces sp. S1D4-14]QDO50483.1 M6 family metalloprotease domain-containing protein [Streptomyces sp. RLB3-5]QDO60724.1 M6 family metalloprotease domain-containing